MLGFLSTYLRGFSWPIFLAMLALLGIGILSVSIAEQVDPAIEGYTVRQLVWATAGLTVFFVATLIPYGKVGRWSYVLFAITLVLLVAVFLFPERRGSRRWIYIPGVESVNLQPSEVAKLTFILALAWYLRFRDNYRRLGGLVMPFLIALVPLGLILKEPDLGTAMLLLPTLLAMLFLAGARLRHLAVIVVLGLLAVLAPVPRAVDVEAFRRQESKFLSWRLGPVTFYRVDESLDWQQRPETPVAYCRYRIRDGGLCDLQPLSLRMMKDHQSRRIKGWLRQDDERIRQNIGWQQAQSVTILGAGRWVGQGGWNANPALTLLPDDHTDFIFSVVGGQWGLLGCLVVLGLYGVILVFGADVAVSTRDPFGRLLAVGVLALTAAQVFINVGMTIGLMPITGMTLPLVSYGGSSLLVNCAALGLLVNVGQHRPVLLARRPFEYGDGADAGGMRLPERAVAGRRR